MIKQVQRTAGCIRAALMGVAVGGGVLLSPPGRLDAAPPKGKPAAKPAAAPAAAAVDVNDLSLRVHAMEAIYELDLSDAQLAAVRAAAAGTAQVGKRTAAKATPKLTEVLRGLQDALAKQDAEKVQDLRPQADEALADDAVDLDDDVAVTDAARAKAPGVVKVLKASQVAAYLAEHADEVADPVELLVDTLADVREPDAEAPDDEMQTTADEVGKLVAGADVARGRQVADQSLAWLKANKALTAEQYTARREAAEAGARKIVGDVPPMQVLANWLDGEVAELLSNPQLVAAIDAMAAGRK
jgi:hypothetical protein